MDRVKFAARGAQAAADALVEVNDRRTALQAPVRLRLDLLLSERKPEVAEGFRRFSGRKAGSLPAGVVVGLDADVGAVEFDELAQVAANGQGLAGVDKAVE